MRISDWGSDVCSSDLIERRRRQGGIVDRDLLVIIEAGALHRHRHILAIEHQRQHHIGLLAYLVTVDRQRVEMQQQRVLIGRSCRKVPAWLVEKDRKRVRVGKEWVSTCGSRWAPYH